MKRIERILFALIGFAIGMIGFLLIGLIILGVIFGFSAHLPYMLFIPVTTTVLGYHYAKEIDEFMEQ